MPFQAHEHHRNRVRLSDDELRPSTGQTRGLEGTAIVASGADDREVFLAVQQAGYDPEQVVYLSVDPPNVALIGGSSLRSEHAE